MINLTMPLDEKQVRDLKVGDEVTLSGVMITARDAAHKYMTEEEATEVKEVLKGGVIYHCGPVVAKTEEGYKFVAAGPTTSAREEPYEAAVMRDYGVRAVIGKGGMGPKTLAACSEYGAVYLHAIGGLAVILAKSVKKVREVHKLVEFGVPEAMWVLEVEEFPAVVTMDSHGNSLHVQVKADSDAQAEKIISEF